MKAAKWDGVGRAERFTYVCDTADREAWLTHRNSGVGASEIAVLLGESEWGSNVELYYRKRGEIDVPQFEQSEEMLWGLLLETAIRDELARRAEVALASAPPKLLRSVAYPWAMATPDALTEAGEPVEVKNLTHGYDAEEWAEQIPEKYLLQCQHQMLVTGANRCLFGALLWGSRLVWEWIPRDEDRIRRIIKAGSEFWACVEAGECPTSDGNPRARKVLASLATNDEPIELFESEIGTLLDRYETAKETHETIAAKEKRAKRQLEAEKDELAKLLGEHREGITASGWKLRWKKSERKGYVAKPVTIQQFEVHRPKI